MSNNKKKPKIISYDDVKGLFEDQIEHTGEEGKKRVKPNHRKTWDLSGDKTFIITNTVPLKAGRDKEDYPELIPIVEHLINIESAKNSNGKEKEFLTKEGKVKHTTIADYLIDTDKSPIKKSRSQLIRIIKRVLSKIEGLEKGEKGYYKNAIN